MLYWPVNIFFRQEACALIFSAVSLKPLIASGQMTELTKPARSLAALQLVALLMTFLFSAEHWIPFLVLRSKI